MCFVAQVRFRNTVSYGHVNKVSLFELEIKLRAKERDREKPSLDLGLLGSQFTVGNYWRKGYLAWVAIQSRQ